MKKKKIIESLLSALLAGSTGMTAGQMVMPVMAAEVTAIIGDGTEQPYPSLSDLINTAGWGAKVTLTSNYTSSSTSTSTNPEFISFSGGEILDGAGHKIFMDQKASMLYEGDGTLKNLTFARTDYAGQPGVMKNGSYALWINGQSKDTDLTFTNCTVPLGGINITTATVTLDVNVDITEVGEGYRNYTVWAEQGSTVDIIGGTYDGYDTEDNGQTFPGFSIVAEGNYYYFKPPRVPSVITISGDTTEIFGDVGSFSYNADSPKNLFVKGGIIHGTADVTANSDKTEQHVSVSGGQFTKEVRPFNTEWGTGAYQANNGAYNSYFSNLNDAIGYAKGGVISVWNDKDGSGTLTYEDNWRDLASYTVTYEDADLDPETVYEGQDFYLPTETGDGRTITKWTDSTGQEYQPGQKVELTGDMTFTATVAPADSGGDDNQGGSSGNTGTGGSTSTPSQPSNPSQNTGTNNGTTGSGEGFTKPGSQTQTDPETGEQTTFTQGEDGTKSATTMDADGNVTDVQVTVPSTAITDGTVSVDLGENSSGQKLKIPGNITEEDKAPEITVNLPASAEGTNVEFELRENTGMPGTVAMIQDEDGNWVPIVESVAIGDDFYVPATGGSTTILVKDNAKTFTDVPQNNWYSDAVAFVSARNIMNGSAGAGSTTFAPNETLSRAMLAQMIANMEGQPNTSKETCPWYLGAMNYVMGKGLMGVSSPFNPDDPIIRQDLALVLWRNAGSPTVSTDVLDKYGDRNQVADYALQAVAWAVKSEILGVNSSLNPTNEATRAEIARMFMAYVTGRATQ